MGVARNPKLACSVLAVPDACLTFVLQGPSYPYPPYAPFGAMLPPAVTYGPHWTSSQPASKSATQNHTTFSGCIGGSTHVSDGHHSGAPTATTNVFDHPHQQQSSETGVSNKDLCWGASTAHQSHTSRLDCSTHQHMPCSSGRSHDNAQAHSSHSAGIGPNQQGPVRSWAGIQPGSFGSSAGDDLVMRMLMGDTAAAEVFQRLSSQMPAPRPDQPPAVVSKFTDHAAAAPQKAASDMPPPAAHCPTVSGVPHAASRANSFHSAPAAVVHPEPSTAMCQPNSIHAANGTTGNGPAIEAPSTSAAADACTWQAPGSMKRQLGKRNFYLVRSLLVRQQEAFVGQLWELHRVHRIQQYLWTELVSPDHDMTAHFEKEACDVLHSQPSLPCPSTLAPGLALVPRGIDPKSVDDLRVAATASLPVHVGLMQHLPSSMKKAVSSQPARVVPDQYFMPRHIAGVHKPVAARMCPPAGARAMSGDPTVQVSPRQQHTGPQYSSRAQCEAGEKDTAAQPAPKAQPVHSQQQPVEANKPHSGPVAVHPQPAVECCFKVPQQQLPGHYQDAVGARQGQQQPSSSMTLLQDAINGADAQPLNAFRPNSQISPHFASQFLAGQPAGMPSFDPHAFWFAKHFQTHMQQQQQQQLQASSAADAAATAAPSSQHAVQESATAPEQQQPQPSSAPAGPSAVPAKSNSQVVRWWQDPNALFGQLGLAPPESLKDGGSLVNNSHKRLRSPSKNGAEVTSAISGPSRYDIVQ